MKWLLPACAIFLAGILLSWVYFDSLVFLFDHWINTEDYSHGLFIPLISGALIWQARHRLAEAGTEHSAWGIAVICLGLLLYWIGELATLYVVLHFSLWLVIVGLVVSFVGIRGIRIIWFPLAYLLTSIPLPVFLYSFLSSQLQLMSSAMGVGFLQLLGVTAFREGNVIDLGPVQLQVVEACSGIRYLLPLTSLAMLCAYLYKDKMWKRVVLVISAIPISILVNGFRIGTIGILVELFGQGAAEGFYHSFEGWVLFMTSLGLLIAEMWILTGSPRTSTSFFERFTLTNRIVKDQEISSACNTMTHGPSRPAKPAYLFSVALLIPFAVVSAVIGEREEFPPARASFVDFPMEIRDWHGSTFSLEKNYIDTLRFDDYLLADFRSHNGQPLNFYSAYYRSQKKGRSAHSPQSCLPGGGWEIASLTRVVLPSNASLTPLTYANRALIQKDDQKQVVLYWFKQRDRILADEYQVKFYLLWDALWRGRTDGALVRLASLVGPGESEETVDQRLIEFARLVQTELTRYVPD